MRVFLILIFVSVFSFLGKSQDVKIIKITDLEKIIHLKNDTTYIINFWATWCAPCVKELPDFDSINTTYKNSRVKVLLVSMDFKEDLQSKLLPFLKSKKIGSEVMLLDESNGNYFIPKVSADWSGAIPATLIINNQKNISHFFEKKLNYLFLKKEIEEGLKSN